MNESNAKIKTALIISTISLLWAIPSISILGVIGTICCWTAYGGKRKGAAKAAAVMYIISAVYEFFLALLFYFGIGMESLRGLLIFGALMSAVTAAAHIICAVMSKKGAGELPDNKSNGLFD